MCVCVRERARVWERVWEKVCDRVLETERQTSLYIRKYKNIDPLSGERERYYGSEIFERDNGVEGRKTDRKKEGGVLYSCKIHYVNIEIETYVENEDEIERGRST